MYSEYGIQENKDTSTTANGVIHSLYKDPQTGGQQPTVAGREGTIVIREELSKGLDGLAEFSHIIAIYYFHQTN